MRLKYLLASVLIIMLLIPLAAQEPTETPDIAASATQLIAEATQTAAAMPTATEAVATDDPFVLTATQFVREATQTVQAGDSQDSAVTPIDGMFDVSEEEFALTATQLIVEATQTSEASPNVEETGSGGNSSPGGGCAPAIIMPMGLALFGLSWSNRRKRA